MNFSCVFDIVLCFWNSRTINRNTLAPYDPVFLIHSGILEKIIYLLFIKESLSIAPVVTEEAVSMLGQKRPTCEHTPAIIIIAFIRNTISSTT